MHGGLSEARLEITLAFQMVLEVSHVQILKSKMPWKDSLDSSKCPKKMLRQNFVWQRLCGMFYKFVGGFHERF